MPTVQREFRSAFADFLTDKTETFATVLVGGMLRLYGIECFSWDPVTIRLELKRDVGVEPSRLANAQIQALISALTTDMFYTDVPTFDQTVNALNRAPIAAQDDIPMVEEVAWACSEVLLNDPTPSEHADVPFSRDIRKYCHVVLRDEGFTIAPTSLKWVDLPPVQSEFHDDPMMFEAAYKNQQLMADAVDQAMQSRIEMLVEHMRLLGLRVPTD
jgi:hypothetical protein